MSVLHPSFFAEGNTPGDEDVVVHPELCLDLVCLHLDHRVEVRRLAEIKKLHEALGGETRGQQILVGDFNALTRTDYSDDEWRQVADFCCVAVTHVFLQYFATIWGVRLK